MFSVYISYRRLKPRPQFSSCAASACTCPRTSWPAGVWETSRITSAHTCLIRASCSTRYTGKSPSSSTCLSLQKQIDVLISIFFSPLEIWTCAWIFPFPHPFFFGYLPISPSLGPVAHWIPQPYFSPLLTLPLPPPLSLPPFLLVALFFSLFIPSSTLIHFCLFEPARTLILSGWLFSWSHTVNSTGHWRNSLSCIRTGTNNTQVFMVVLKWTCFISLLSQERIVKACLWGYWGGV